MAETVICADWNILGLILPGAEHSDTGLYAYFLATEQSQRLSKGSKLHVVFPHIPRLGLLCSTQVVQGLPENGRSMKPFNLNWKSDILFFSNNISIFTQYYFINKHINKSCVLLIVIYPDIYDCRKLAVTVSKGISIFCLNSSSWQ